MPRTTPVTLTPKHPLARLLLAACPAGSTWAVSSGNTAAAQAEIRLQLPGHGTVAYCKLLAGGTLYVGHRANGLPAANKPGALLLAPGSKAPAAGAVVRKLQAHYKARATAQAAARTRGGKPTGRVRKAGTVAARPRVRRKPRK